VTIKPNQGAVKHSTICSIASLMYCHMLGARERILMNCSHEAVTGERNPPVWEGTKAIQSLSKNG
jgi:hypothetical protein